MGKRDIIWAAMAERTKVLGVDIGSRGFGVNLPDSDHDHKFVCVEDLSAYVRLSDKFVSLELKIPKGVDPDFPEGRDLQYFALDRFLHLAMGGNPTILTILYAPSIYEDERGVALRNLAPKIISLKAGIAYFEFMRNELARWEESLADPTYEGGVDWKRAMHVVRLGMQGVELLETGVMKIPLGMEDRDYLLRVRKGEVHSSEVQSKAEALMERIKFLIGKGSLQKEPDYKFIDCWMRSVYWDRWQSNTNRELLIVNGERANDLPKVH